MNPSTTNGNNPRLVFNRSFGPGWRRPLTAPPGLTALLAVLAAFALFLAVTGIAQAQQASDATLSSLTVSPKDIIGFTPDRTDYEVGVAANVARATIIGTENATGATVAYSVTDLDSNTAGYQFNLSAGRNEVTVTVTAIDGTTIETYTVSVNRGVTDDFGWKAALDLDGLIAAGNDAPYGLWSDGDTMWVADWRDDKIYAYNTDGTHDSTEDFNTLSAATNTNPRGIWSDGTTMWVADTSDDKIYAYRMFDQSRDSSEDFDTLSAATNTDLGGIWSEGVTMWVADWSDDKIYAYRMSDQVRDSDKEFNMLNAVGIANPIGIWSDGATMWVADSGEAKIYAFNTDGTPDSAKDFNTLAAAGNDAPSGIWSDGTTMWVVDQDDDKVYSYNMPADSMSITEPRLRSLTLSGVTLGQTFHWNVFDYAGSVPGGTTQTTVTALTFNSDATAVIKVNGVVDTDGTVALTAGANEITVEVTAEDGATMRTYTVTLTRRVSISRAQLRLNADESGTYTVVLDTQPVGGSVTVTINDPAGPAVSASPSSLTFNGNNWDTPKTVSVVVSPSADTNQVVHTITHTVSGADYGTAGVTAADVVVTVADSDIDPDAAGELTPWCAADATGADCDSYYYSPGYATRVIQAAAGESEVDYVRVHMYATRQYRFRLNSFSRNSSDLVR